VSETQPSTSVGAVAEPRLLCAIRHWLGPLLSVPTPLIFAAAATVATIFLWRQGSLEAIGPAISAVPPWWILAILLGYGLSLSLLGMRWHTLVRLAGGTPAWPRSAEVFLTSVIVNYAAPIGLAVPTRAALTVRDLGLTVTQSGVVVGWELGLDVAALSAISAIWVAQDGARLVQTATLDGRVVAIASGVLAIAAVTAAVLVAARRVRNRLGRVLQPMFLLPKQRPETALWAVALTGVFWSAQLAVMTALLAVFGVSATPALIFGLMGPPVLIGMLSPIPGGAGVREALMVAVARFAALPAAPVLLASVAYRLALFAVTPLIWGTLRVVGRGHRSGR
jgi:uncharacterized membrane protein YbhN (UPF0104 family)